MLVGCAGNVRQTAEPGISLRSADFARGSVAAESTLPDPASGAPEGDAAARAAGAGRLTLGAGDGDMLAGTERGSASPSAATPAAAATTPATATTPAAGRPGTGPPAARREIGPGDRVIVESMVGQINGRPFFADRFFVPIADQLGALGRQLPMREFLERAQAIIATHLQAEVLNALFIAEAQAMLTAEEQVGLRAWLASTREVITARRGGGTVEAARRRISEEEDGLSLEEYVEAIRDAQLLRQLFERRIEPRVIVSQLDIEREYARRFAEFNPPSRVRIDRIRLSKASQAELIEDVTRRLAEDESFASIAESLGSPAAGFWQEIEAPGGDLTQVEFADERVREAMHALDAPGAVTRPIDLGSAVWWLSVASIDQAEGLSVYDPFVQRMLASEIRSARMSEEQQRFTNLLLREGIYDEMGGMVERLLVIAADRYGPR